MKNQEGGFFGTIAAAAILLPPVLTIIFLLQLYKGYAIMLAWNWLLPTTLGVPFLSYWGAVALVFVVSALTCQSYQYRDPPDDREPIEKFKDLGKLIVFSLLLSSWIILGAWILTWFVY